MIAVNSEPFMEKMEAMYFNKILQENIEYRKQHGKGPYEFRGKFSERVTPYLDAGYWLGFDKWLKTEFNINHAAAFGEYQFETSEEATVFILRWS